MRRARLHVDGERTFASGNTGAKSPRTKSLDRGVRATSSNCAEVRSLFLRHAQTPSRTSGSRRAVELNAREIKMRRQPSCNRKHGFQRGLLQVAADPMSRRFRLRRFAGVQVSEAKRAPFAKSSESTRTRQPAPRRVAFQLPLTRSSTNSWGAPAPVHPSVQYRAHQTPTHPHAHCHAP